MEQDMETLLRRQWDTLRTWLDEVGVAGFADLPSGLPAWTVRDLVVHLGCADRPRLASDSVDWIRLATGRTPSADPHLPLL